MKKIHLIIKLYIHSRKVWHASDFWKHTRFFTYAAVFANLFVACLEFFWWHKWVIGLLNTAIAMFCWFFNWKQYMSTMERRRDEFYEKWNKEED